MRDKMDQVQLLTWNDYGESSYIGPIEGDMPPGVSGYANCEWTVLVLADWQSTIPQF